MFFEFEEEVEDLRARGFALADAFRDGRGFLGPFDGFVGAIISDGAVWILRWALMSDTEYEQRAG